MNRYIATLVMINLAVSQVMWTYPFFEEMKSEIERQESIKDSVTLENDMPNAKKVRYVYKKKQKYYEDISIKIQSEKKKKLLGSSSNSREETPKIFKILSGKLLYGETAV